MDWKCCGVEWVSCWVVAMMGKPIVRAAKGVVPQTNKNRFILNVNDALDEKC